MSSLLPIVMAAMMVLMQTERLNVDPVPELAQGIVNAVETDELLPITGSKQHDAMLLTRWEWDETRFGWKWVKGHVLNIPCQSGDDGRSLGPLQLQRVARDQACDPFEAPRIWLARAHESVRVCSAAYQSAGVFDPSAALAQLASGSCWRGRNLSRARVAAARSLLLQASGSELSEAFLRP